MTRWPIAVVVAGLVAAACGESTETASPGSAQAPEVTAARVEVGREDGEVVTIESWRREDRPIWEDVLIPAFEAEHPGIELVFAPSPPTLYDSELAERRELGTAGEIVACRPFARSAQLHASGVLAAAGELVDLSAFPPSATRAWTSAEGEVYCVPTASVAHGFLYNAEILADLEIDPPTTEAEFFALLDEILADGRYDPLAIGLADGWEMSETGLLSIGPSYWNGEAGRVAIVNGEVDLAESGVAEAFAAIQRWGDYLPVGAELLSSDGAFDLFRSRGAVVFPAGSWELSRVLSDIEFDVDFFPPPRRSPGEACQITEELDIGFGILTSAVDNDAALVVLEWLASAEFANAHAEALPGFFALHPDAAVAMAPLVARFEGWRSECERSLRLPTQFVEGGQESVRELLWRQATELSLGQITIDDAMADLGRVMADHRPSSPIEPIYG